jgi:hypothetical protein
MIYVSYHLGLELSYLMDSFAMPPPLPDEKVPHLKHGSSEDDNVKFSLEFPESKEPKDQHGKTTDKEEHMNRKTKEINIAKESSESDSTMISVSSDTDRSLSVTNEMEGVCISTQGLHGAHPVSCGVEGLKGVQKLVVEQKEGILNAAVQPTASQNSLSVANTEDRARKRSISLSPILPIRQRKLSKSQSMESSELLGESCPLGLSGKDQLEVLEDTNQRRRTNSGELKTMAEYKKHRRSSSDVSGRAAALISTDVTGKAKAEVADFSDPLQDYQKTKDENIFSRHHDDNIQLQESKVSTHKFKKTLNELVISVSPLVKLDMPYLETETGQTCKLRDFFPGNCYWSAYLDNTQQK